VLNFGFGAPSDDVNYTFYYNCSGTAPAFLPNTGLAVAYTIINRYDAANTTVPDETDQLFRLGAAGLMSSTTPNPTGSPIPLGCVGIGDTLEAVWNSPSFSAVPPLCTAALPPVAQAALCGLYSRFDNQTQPGACVTGVTDYSALQPVYLPDPDIVTGQADLYSAYTGNGRRVITVPVVDALALNTAATMTVLGFRQFLVQPNPDGTFFNPSDPNGRFVATYIGSPMPVKQGTSTTASRRVVPHRCLRAPERWYSTNEARARRQHGCGAGDVVAGDFPVDWRAHTVRQDHLHLLLAAKDHDHHRQLPGGAERVNFCPDAGDPTIAAAIEFALTGTTDGSGTPAIFDLTPDMIAVTTQCIDPVTLTLGDCATGAAARR